MNNSVNDFSSIILAGGFSSRMDGFKPTMCLDNKTLIEHVVSIYRSVGIEEIFVVTGYRSYHLEDVAKKNRLKLIHNKKYKNGMFSSILTGIINLPESIKYFFIHPVDIPLVRSSSISKLMNAAMIKKVDVLYPIFDKLRGHPPLINITLREKILSWNHNVGGLDQCLEKNKNSYFNVPVVDQNILIDADTPKDFRLLISKFYKKNILSPIECRILMEQILKIPNEIISHCRMVANIAVILAKNINNTGNLKLDVDLIESSALIHDIARTRSNHAKIGAKILNNMGYKNMADIVSKHMDLNVCKSDSISESEVVYLADKLVDGNRLVNLKARFKRKIILHRGDGIINKNIYNRIKNAYKVKVKIENIISNKIDSLLEKNLC